MFALALLVIEEVGAVQMSLPLVTMDDVVNDDAVCFGDVPWGLLLKRNVENKSPELVELLDGTFIGSGKTEFGTAAGEVLLVDTTTLLLLELPLVALPPLALPNCEPVLPMEVNAPPTSTMGAEEILLFSGAGVIVGGG